MRLPGSDRSVRTLLRTYSDWLLVAFVGISLITVGVGIYVALKPQPAPKPKQIVYSNGDPNAAGISKIVPFNLAFPPPAKTQLAYYRIYKAGDIRYSIEILQVNSDRYFYSGSHTFKVILYNLRNAPIQTDARSTLGCIAQDYPYRAVTIDEPIREVPGAGKLEYTLTLDYSCVYIGTADGKYFWYIH